MRSNQERLLDILEAIQRIQKYAAQGKDTFDRSELIHIRKPHIPLAQYLICNQTNVYVAHFVIAGTCRV